MNFAKIYSRAHTTWLNQLKLIAKEHYWLQLERTLTEATKINILRQEQED